VRGRWGEIQLRRVAELAGMIENCDFTEQTSVRTSDGTLRPDMIVNLPSNRTIVIDAKTPLDAFISAVESQDDGQRSEHFERHANQMESKVRELSAKQYSAQFSQSPDFVVLFIPGESFLQAAVQLRPRMIEDAMEKNVIIATPSTLIALLKAVAMGWREQRLAENAQKISELGRELHSRLGTAFSHVGNLGKAVGSTVSHFNKLVGSLETSVLPQARRFLELGADSPKELPAQLEPVETLPREVASSESDTVAER
jgi:DNA recombination protein RmuC